MLAIIKKLNLLITSRVEQSGMPYFIFGIFGIINYPASFFYWHFINPADYENLTFRLIASFLCFGLVVKNLWPAKIQNYFPLYWYFTVLFSLPYFGTYMVLHNHLSIDWIMNMLLGLYLFVLLVDWVSFMLMLVIGTILGSLTYIISGGDLGQISSQSWSNAVYMYSFALLIGGLFSRNNFLTNLIHQERQKVEFAEKRALYNKQIGASIAHELRNPLATIKLCAKGIENYLVELVDTYRLAQTKQLPVPAISTDVLAHIPEALESITNESNAALIFIDMLLMKLN